MGFYRGVLSPLCALTLLSTINFSLYEVIKKSLQNISSNGHNIDDSSDHRSDMNYDWRVTLAGMIYI